MIFAIECVVACVLFTVALEILCARRREIFINDYPPVVSDKLILVREASLLILLISVMLK